LILYHKGYKGELSFLMAPRRHSVRFVYFVVN
jgi:hypothetical protein